MKKLLSIFLIAASVMFGADAANDIVLSQRKSDNSGFIQRNVAPAAGGFITFDANKIPVPLALNTLSYSATTDIVMTKNLNTVTLAGNITFTTSAKAAGLYVTVRVVGDGSNRTLAFPGTWVWVGSTAPTTLIANKVGVLSLICFGTNDSDIVASWVSSL